MIRLADPRPEWPTEFEALAARLRAALGPLAIRVDHVGSTAVPGLLAKDVVDAQVIVRSAGFEPRQGAWNMRDQLPAGWRESAEAWDKLVSDQKRESIPTTSTCEGPEAPTSATPSCFETSSGRTTTPVARGSDPVNES